MHLTMNSPENAVVDAAVVVAVGGGLKRVLVEKNLYNRAGGVRSTMMTTTMTWMTFCLVKKVKTL